MRELYVLQTTPRTYHTESMTKVVKLDADSCVPLHCPPISTLLHQKEVQYSIPVCQTARPDCTDRAASAAVATALTMCPVTSTTDTASPASLDGSHPCVKHVSHWFR